MRSTRDETVLALAEVWAAIDGRLDFFVAGKNKDADFNDGTFDGYMIEASEMLSQLEAKGWRMVRPSKPTEV